MARLRFPILLVSLLWVAGACSPEGGGKNRDLVCGITQARFDSPALDNGSAWDWPGEIQHAIEAHRWIVADKALVKECGGAMGRVDKVAYSADRSLAQITLNYFPLPGEPGFEAGEGGSITTCLLRREKVMDIEHWALAACKLDAAS